MGEIKKERSKSILEQIEASRKKLHSEIILVTLKSDELVIGKFDEVHLDDSTGDGFVILSGRKIVFDDIRKVE